MLCTLGDGEQPGQALSMISKDGEEVGLKTPVTVSDSGVKEWLKALETEMRNTLALLLRDAVESTGDLSNTSRDDVQVRIAFCFFGRKE